MRSDVEKSASLRAQPDLSGYPDTILINGNIVTVDGEFSIANAVAVRDGRILAVGANDDIKQLAGPSTAVVDLEGRTVLPGLIDTHAHVERAGLLKYTVQLDDVTTVAQALARISEYADRTPKGKWIRGGQWHPVAQLAEKRFLTRDELDKASPNNPVCLPIGHFTLVNSEALALARITGKRQIPKAGSSIAMKARANRTALWRRLQKTLCTGSCPIGRRTSATSS